MRGLVEDWGKGGKGRREGGGGGEDGPRRALNWSPMDESAREWEERYCEMANSSEVVSDVSLSFPDSPSDLMMDACSTNVCTVNLARSRALYQITSLGQRDSRGGWERRGRRTTPWRGLRCGTALVAPLGQR